MRRSLYMLSLVISATALVACNNSTATDAGNNDSGNGGNDAGSDAGCGGGTIVSVSTMNALPTPFQSANPGDFSDSKTATVAPYMNELVELMTASTSASGAPGAGCPPLFVYTASSGKSYCDGFNAAVTSGGTTTNVLVDDFSYLSSAQSTACSGSFSNTNLPYVKGIWEDYYNSSFDGGQGTDVYAIALTSCADIGMGTAYAGTGTAPTTPPANSQLVATLLASGVDGSTATVSGIVVAAWGPSSTGSFGFSLTDPGTTTTAAAGLAVSRSSSSTSCAAAPSIGDYVTVTGTFKKTYGEMKL